MNIAKVAIGTGLGAAGGALLGMARMSGPFYGLENGPVIPSGELTTYFGLHAATGAVFGALMGLMFD